MKCVFVQVSVSVLSKALSSCPLLFSHALPLTVLSFIFLYPELSERFGAPALKGCMSCGSEETPEQELLELLHTHPAALLSTLVTLTHKHYTDTHTYTVNPKVIQTPDIHIKTYFFY